MPESAQKPPQRAPEDIHARGVAWGAAAIATGVAVAASVSYLLWHWWGIPAGAPNTRDVPAMTPPVLQSAPQPERAQYFAEKEGLLKRWEWIDRPAGVARIPVEEAMQIMAARGARAAQAAQTSDKTSSAPQEEKQ